MGRRLLALSTPFFFATTEGNSYGSYGPLPLNEDDAEESRLKPMPDFIRHLQEEDLGIGGSSADDKPFYKPHPNSSLRYTDNFTGKYRVIATYRDEGPTSNEIQDLRNHNTIVDVVVNTYTKTLIVFVHQFQDVDPAISQVVGKSNIKKVMRDQPVSHTGMPDPGRDMSVFKEVQQMMSKDLVA